LRVRHGEESEGSDAVDDPVGGSGPHLTPPHHWWLVGALAVKDDVLGAEGLVGAWQSVVGRSAQGLRHVAVGLRLPDQELTPPLPEQLGEPVFGRRLERAKEEEETAIEERWELQNINSSISRGFY